MNMPPNSGPATEATPPTTRPTNRVMDRNRVKLSGATKPIEMAPREPAIPVTMALTAKVRVLNKATSMPVASAASAWSRMARMASPMRPWTRL